MSGYSIFFHMKGDYMTKSKNNAASDDIIDRLPPIGVIIHPYLISGQDKDKSQKPLEAEVNAHFDDYYGAEVKRLEREEAPPIAGMK